MIADGELTPDTYRVTLDDGSSADYQLAGVVHSDHGDSLVYQPDEQAEALAGDFRIAIGRVQFICGLDGELYYFPTNRAVDAEPVSNERRAELTYTYLQQSPYAAPVQYEMTPEQEAALFIVLGLDNAPTSAESPENPPVELEQEPDTADPKSAAPVDPVESKPEQAEINLESGPPSVTSETPLRPNPDASQPDPSPLPSPVSPTSDQPGSSPPASPPTADSPVLATPSPLDGAATPAEPLPASGAGDHATATEILLVNVEDEPQQ